MPFQTPVRIYVLWHPQCKEGPELARRIYHWFRLPGGDGIPVYFRCAANPEADSFPIIPRNCDHNIIIPLIDPHMVASMPWRRLAEKLNGIEAESDSTRWHLLPVALHDTAYQMPSSVRKLNFIRQLDAPGADAKEALMTRLTEALCLLLRRLANPSEINPIKIFLSHAKADGTDIPKKLKSFIQTETQCHTFFDENDIAYGHDFAEVIRSALESESAGLLVVQGDHYADRPWCRKEIRDFLLPVQIQAHATGSPPMFSVMPAVVVTNFDGIKVARTIPELGHTPSVQWKPGTARAAVVTLLREILFSSFYRLLARKVVNEGPAGQPNGTRLLVNRPPDPVMIEHLLRLAKVDRTSEAGVTIHHPGHGLSGVELKGLQLIYPTIRFHAFGALKEETAATPEVGLFAAKVLAISAGNATDGVDAGLSDEHTVELLTKILHPLFKEDLSLLYGGSLPDWNSKPAWQSPVNFTETFLNLLLAERDKTESNPSSAVPRHASRLFNLSAWPDSLGFSIEDEARWINTCSFLRVDQEAAGIPVADRLPEPDFNGDDSTATQANMARCLTAMRRRACGKISCDIPEDPEFSFTPLAHLFIGGKLTGYSGIMPGIWEEVLHALDQERPCFIVGATQGAAGKLAGWLLAHPRERPDELSPDHQLRQCRCPAAVGHLEQAAQSDPSILLPRRALDELWGHLERSDPDNLTATLRNGLDPASNRELLEATDFRRIAELIRQGLEALATSTPQSLSP
ncbi:TIR domain-containing protein [Luteolibacter marinus]|uniref:TIR domain-containing protein n=1 Tax=Luteolibacter marinus TaxID=2776705 RepID=UPI0018692E83|nr:TIR domain-containing protein [Luteolibacter marinus]